MSNIEDMVRFNMAKYGRKLPNGMIPVPNKTTVDPSIALEQARSEISQMDKAIRAGPRDRKI